MNDNVSESGELRGHVSFQCDVWMRPWHTPRNYVHNIRGTISVLRDGCDPENAGTLKFRVIKGFEAISDHLDAPKLFKASGLYHVYRAMFAKEYSFNPRYSIQAGFYALMVIDAVNVAPAYQSTFLLVQGIETALATYVACGVAVAQRDMLPIYQWRQLGFRRAIGTDFVFRDNAGVFSQI